MHDDTSRFGRRTFEHRTLDDAELNAVTGGLSHEEVKLEYTERGAVVQAGWNLAQNKKAA